MEAIPPGNRWENDNEIEAIPPRNRWVNDYEIEAIQPGNCGGKSRVIEAIPPGIRGGNDDGSKQASGWKCLKLATTSVYLSAKSQQLKISWTAIQI